MQQYLNYRSVDAGLVTAPLGIFAVILAPVMGRVLPRTDARVVATMAFIGFAIVFYMRSRYVIEIDTWHLVLPTLLQGHSDGAVFRAIDVDHLVGVAALEDSGCGGIIEFRAGLLRGGGDVACGQCVDGPDRFAS